MVEMLHAFHLGDLAAYTGDVKVNKNKVASVRQAAMQQTNLL